MSIKQISVLYKQKQNKKESLPEASSISKFIISVTLTQTKNETNINRFYRYIKDNIHSKKWRKHTHSTEILNYINKQEKKTKQNKYTVYYSLTTVYISELDQTRKIEEEMKNQTKTESK